MAVKGNSVLISAVLLVIFAIGVAGIYDKFGKEFIIKFMQAAEENNKYHGYTVAECAKFQPNLIMFLIKSNYTYGDKPIKVSSTVGTEELTYNGKPVAKLGDTVLTVWHINDTSYFSLADVAGNIIKNTTQLTHNASFLSTYTLKNNLFLIVEQYYNGTNFELNINIVDLNGNIINSKRLTFNEENQRIPDITTNGTHIAIAYVQDKNETFDIQVMFLDSSLNIIGIYDITSDDALQYNPSITYFQGNFYVAYETYEYGNATIQLVKLTPSGTVQLIGNVTNNRAGSYLPILASSSNHLLVGYEYRTTEGTYEIRYSIYDTTLAKVVDNSLAYVSIYNQHYPSATFGNGKFVLSWVEDAGIVRGIRINDLDLSLYDTFTIITPTNIYAAALAFDNGIFAVVRGGYEASLWDLYLTFMADKLFYATIDNPSSLNVTITDARIFFKDGSTCTLVGQDYIDAYSKESYIGYDCDAIKRCEDIEKIRLGSECGVIEFRPQC